MSSYRQKKKTDDWRSVLKYGETHSGLFNNLPKGDNYEYVKEPCFDVQGAENRILFVLDWVPKEDLESGSLLSGFVGDTFRNMLKETKRLYLNGTKLPTTSWRVMSYSAYRTIGKPRTMQDSLAENFTRRVVEAIKKYKPTTVVACGASVMRALCAKQIELSEGRLSPWLGNLIPKKLGGHRFNVMPALSFTTLCNGNSAEASLIGYQCRLLANALSSRHIYRIDNDAVTEHRSILVDTISKFDKLMDHLYEAEVVSIDSETANLNRIKNTLQTIQFATSDKYGYILPYAHKDSPFAGKELKYIRNRLRSFFEGDNKNKYHIYANAKFDLTQFRTAFGVRHFANDLWDIFAGEFALDENLKALDAALGEYYYSLENLAMQYGCDAYYVGGFKKSDRVNIAHMDLEGDLLRYCTFDVVIPLLIHKQQQARAKAIGYTKYPIVVRKQLSDTIHGFSIMEHTGSGVDVEHLFYLRTPNSPIEKVIRNMEGELLASPAVKKASAILARAQGRATKTLFDTDVVDNAFSLRKNEHKQVLFFKALKLEPLAYGTAVDSDGNKVPKVDKAFQAKYAEVPEVKAFTEISKAKKLKNAYVKSFISLLASSEDFRSDNRIRPNYKYLPVVTYRTSASDPNLQQIPTRSELGKLIKRLFIARPGCLYVKVDYRVHEVRGWGIISNDAGVAKSFAKAKKMRDEYRTKPTEALAKRMVFEADIHIINVMYFFKKTIEELTKDEKLRKLLRDAVKGITFGLIYCKGIKALSQDIKRTVEETEEIVEGFVKNFPAGMRWIEAMKKFARENYFVESLIGTRRNSFSYIMPNTREGYIDSAKLQAQSDRQSVNAPIQGMCAQFMSIGQRCLDKLKHKFRVTNKEEPQIYVNNSVHDSLENEAGYRHYMLSLNYIEHALTDGVNAEVKARYGVSLISDLEIDFELGPCLSKMKAWDFGFASLVKITLDGLKWQIKELKHEIDIPETMDLIFTQYQDYPKWLLNQLRNLKDENIDFMLMQGDGEEKSVDAEAKKYVKRYARMYRDQHRAAA